MDVIISYTRRYVFVSIPKSGTRAMYGYLASHANGVRYGDRFHQIDRPPEAEGFFLFSAVRDPILRMVSLWYHMIFKSEHRDTWRTLVRSTGFRGFVEFAVKKHDLSCLPPDGNALASQYDYLWRSGYGYIPVIRIEHTDKELPEFPPFSFLDKPRVPRINSFGAASLYAEYGDWRTIVTPEVMPLVEEWAGEDFAYGYPRAAEREDWRSIWA